MSKATKTAANQMLPIRNEIEIKKIYTAAGLCWGRNFESFDWVVCYDLNLRKKERKQRKEKKRKYRMHSQNTLTRNSRMHSQGSTTTARSVALCVVNDGEM